MTKKREKMLVIGLTGSIGMGKSVAAGILGRKGLPVYSADRAVHALLGPGGAAAAKVAKRFPEVLLGKSIDRNKLGLAVFAAPAKLRQLEKILHPLTLREEKKFLAAARRRGADAAVLEIPLLFETKAEKRCDVTICVTAPPAMQKRRVLRRPGMTAGKFRAIVKRQMPDREKRRRAGFVVDTGKGYADTRRRLERILRELL